MEKIIKQFLSEVNQRNQNEPEFMQAVTEVAETVIPYIVTKDELPDFQKLNMFLDVDGKRMQTGNTEQMIFDIKTLVSYMSSCMSLHPGDICCTGTPPGVGENMSPPHFLKGGEEVVLGVDQLGEQKHKVVPYKG